MLWNLRMRSQDGHCALHGGQTLLNIPRFNRCNTQREKHDKKVEILQKKGQTITSRPIDGTGGTQKQEIPALTQSH